MGSKMKTMTVAQVMLYFDDALRFSMAEQLRNGNRKAVHNRMRIAVTAIRQFANPALSG
ncbi:MAG: hypothetical protein JOZ14_16400 [Acidobacteria bacterium]|nr:hypothetical protein [Acidobacteriota bacterium]